MSIRFEDKIDVIEQQLSKRKAAWRLSSVNYMDWDDVKQIIRIHIHKKWYQWRQNEPIEPWLNTIITNQIKNLLRDNYYSFTRPCLGVSGKPCAANEGGDLCAITASGKQDESCPLYAKWIKTKKRAYDVKLPVSIDDNIGSINHSQESFVEYPDKIGKMHDKMLKHLSTNQYRIYKMLYIDHLSDEEIAKRMGYTTRTQRGRKNVRYKQLEVYKKMFLEIARGVVGEVMFNE